MKKEPNTEADVWEQGGTVVSLLAGPNRPPLIGRIGLDLHIG